MTSEVIPPGQGDSLPAEKNSGLKKFAVMTLSSFIILEVLLQVVSFILWYHEELNRSAVILFVSDTKTKYPGALRQHLNKTGTNFKVVDLVSPQMSLSNAERVLEDFVSKVKPAVVYITIGAETAIENTRISPMYQLHWNNSFQLKFRTRKLANFIYKRKGHIRRVFESPVLRQVSTRSNPPSSRFTPHEAQQVPAVMLMSNPLGLATAIGSKTTETFQNFPVDKLSPNLASSNVPFPLGTWNTTGIEFNFKSDGILEYAGVSARWKAEGNRLVWEKQGKSREFFWTLDRNTLLLAPVDFPFVLCLKSGAAKEKRDSKYFDRQRLAWRRIGIKDKRTVDFFLRLKQDLPDDPAADAFLSRIYFSLNRLDLAEKHFNLTKEMYQWNPDQRAAESLYYAAYGSEQKEKVRLGKMLLTQYPRSARLWATLATYAQEAGYEDVASGAKREVLRILPQFMETPAFLKDNVKADLKTLDRLNKNPKGNPVKIKGAQLKESTNVLIRIAEKCSSGHIPLVFVPYTTGNLKNNRLMYVVHRVLRVPILTAGETKESKISWREIRYLDTTRDYEGKIHQALIESLEEYTPIQSSR